MNKQLYNKTLNLLKDGVEIKGDFYSNQGRVIEFKSSDEDLNNNLSDWFYEYEDLLYQAENYISDSGEIELMIKYDCVCCKIEATIYGEYDKKHSKNEIITKRFLKILNQYTSKAIDELAITSDIEFDLRYDSRKNDFETLDIYVNENPVSLNKKDLNQVKEEFISVFKKWDNNYFGEDLEDEIEKCIEYTYDGNEFDITEFIILINEVEPEEF